MLDKETYDKIIPYKEVVQFFAKHGEYVGGADGLFEYLKSIGHDYQPSCISCMAALLLTANRMINEYERNLPGV